MKAVFVDTGAWIATVQPQDHMHRAAASFLAKLADDRVPLLTTNYVVAETATRLRYDAGIATALRFRALVERATTTGRLRIEWIGEAVHNDGWELLERYADVRLSMTDVTSASMARAAKITTIFGFDSDFRALGFNLQPVL